MSMKILKASAGSGKTYNLTKEYIKLLLASESRDAYRHILAVTFTNKATDEMKRRILGELYTLATAPERSPYHDNLVPSVIATTADLKRKAEAMMTGILHDYSGFAVSTIDKFFQQTLRAFSREIGQFAPYQVELDKDALVDDAVDRVMDNLSENNGQLLKWVINGVKFDLATTGRFNLDKRLREFASSVVSENPADVAFSRESLASVKDACTEIILRFSREVACAAEAVVDALEQAHVSAADTNRGFMKSIYPYMTVTAREAIIPPTVSFMDKAATPEKWFAKTKMHLLETAVDYVYGPLQDFIALFGARYKEYATAQTINGQIYSLGLAEELRKAFVDVQRQRGVISIDDTNTILHDIIDGTETPFLYEKLGVRFENFLLDEFQDTSGVQWENFLPLLQNSDANGNENLVVGDVKQSIYRWRGSQWDLLDSRLQKQFRVPASDITVLDGNYRTCKAVVDFNNHFFPYAADEVDRLIGNSPADPDSVRSIYGDVIQEKRSKDQGAGYVSVAFVEDSDKELDEVVKCIRGAVERGARWSDIAVLVRANSDGSMVAEKLVASGIPVVSDDSLYVKSSVTVRRLMSQLELVDNPSRAESNSVAGYLAREMRIELPTRYHCLTDLAEGVLAGLRKASPELFDSEAPFVQAFMDWLQEWTRKNGSNLGAMLRDWQEAEPKIASPEGLNAVRVMTVHKSKGLEFPYVIFPFAEKVTLYKPTAYWCQPNVQGTGLERIAGKRFRASLSDGSMNTLFSEDYVKERSQQAVDNMNVMYVAMTRAKCELSVIASMPPKFVVDAVEGEKDVPSKSLSHVLYSYVKRTRYESGTPYDYNTLDRRSTGPQVIELGYVCNDEKARSRMRLRLRPREVEPLDDETMENQESATNVVPATDETGPEANTSEQVIEPTLF